MIRDQRDDIDDDDEDEILQDGHSIRVPISFMDAEATEMLRQKYRGHRPGFRYAADDDDAHEEAQEARDEYIRYLQDAHRQPAAIADDDEPYQPTSIADAKREAERAYDERSEWLRNAHKGSQP